MLPTEEKIPFQTPQNTNASTWKSSQGVKKRLVLLIPFIPLSPAHTDCSAVSVYFNLWLSSLQMIDIRSNQTAVNNFIKAIKNLDIRMIKLEISLLKIPVHKQMTTIRFHSSAVASA